VQTLRIDLVDSLTVKELDIASRLLKEDLVHAITAPTAGRWKGLAVLAYMTAKRQGDPTAKLSDYLDLGADELVTELARLAGDVGLLEDLNSAEAELARLEAADPDEELAAAKVEDTTSSVSGPETAEVDENPTKRPRASSSRGPGARTRGGSPR